ncbi:hypothetical protein HYV57_06030 [Candidatus Peregrinibacteria bacterium]|nr:hypothetical protein [Candidatus Peregrinibacteria bacterium]
MVYFSFFYWDIRKSTFLEEYCKKIEPQKTTIETIQTDLKDFVIKESIVIERYDNGRLEKNYIPQEFAKSMKEDTLKEVNPNIRRFSVNATDKPFDFKTCVGIYEIASGKIQDVYFVED